MYAAVLIGCVYVCDVPWCAAVAYGRGSVVRRPLPVDKDKDKDKESKKKNDRSRSDQVRGWGRSGMRLYLLPCKCLYELACASACRKKACVHLVVEGEFSPCLDGR